jgi:hypothetical protein
MPQHHSQHHLNTGILHFGLFTDKQMGPVLGMVCLALLAVVAGNGLFGRMILPLIIIFPAVVMVLDNHGGGMFRRWFRGWLDYKRSVGRYEPGADPDDTPGYPLVDARAAARAAQPAIERLLDD